MRLGGKGGGQAAMMVSASDQHTLRQHDQRSCDSRAREPRFGSFPETADVRCAFKVAWLSIYRMSNVPVPTLSHEPKPIGTDTLTVQPKDPCVLVGSFFEILPQVDQRPLSIGALAPRVAHLPGPRNGAIRFAGKGPNVTLDESPCSHGHFWRDFLGELAKEVMLGSDGGNECARYVHGYFTRNLLWTLAVQRVYGYVSKGGEAFFLVSL